MFCFNIVCSSFIDVLNNKLEDKTESMKDLITYWLRIGFRLNLLNEKNKIDTKKLKSSAEFLEVRVDDILDFMLNVECKTRYEQINREKIENYLKEQYVIYLYGLFGKSNKKHHYVFFLYSLIPFAINFLFAFYFFSSSEIYKAFNSIKDINNIGINDPGGFSLDNETTKLLFHCELSDQIVFYYAIMIFVTLTTYGILEKIDDASNPDNIHPILKLPNEGRMQIFKYFILHTGIFSICYAIIMFPSIYYFFNMKKTFLVLFIVLIFVTFFIEKIYNSSWLFILLFIINIICVGIIIFYNQAIVAEFNRYIDEQKKERDANEKYMEQIKVKVDKMMKKLEQPKEDSPKVKPLNIYPVQDIQQDAHKQDINGYLKTHYPPATHKKVLKRAKDEEALRKILRKLAPPDIDWNS